MFFMAEKYKFKVYAFEEVEDPEESSITLTSGNRFEPAPRSPYSIEDSNSPCKVLAGTTRALYGKDVLVSPGLTTVNTDTRHYWNLTKNIYRFAPGWDPKDEGLGNMHTVNERVGRQHHVNGVQWFSMFIRNIDEADIE